MSNIPDIEERFQAPDSWRWGTLKHKGRKLRYGVSFPKDTTPDAVVVFLPGLSEFGEKYFELARDLNARNMAFWVIDWMGHGKSDRYFEERPHKRHSRGFQNDVDDLHALYLDYIKHSSVHPDVGRIPRVMLAHSMGANIGLRYLKQHPDTFDCACLSAPMFGIHGLNNIPLPVAYIMTAIISLFAGRAYASGQTDWRETLRPAPGKDIFSSDEKRGAIHNFWCLFDPELQTGGITWRWLHEAVKSCLVLQKPSFLKSIKTPCLIATAGQDTIVNNAATERVVKNLPHAHHINLDGAKHEIFMEDDKFRTILLNAFQRLVQEHVIDNPERLQRF